ncbi:sensor histidine kinase [Cellulomonas fimi]|uniref:sensor histidine kinase n=1 Tax=Cellulomonas fimi TaxID=1708 RepID=UPI002358921C|nr:histidine kinase [Cellulomonas fimi]
MSPSRVRVLVDTVLVVVSLALTVMAVRGGWSAVPAGVVAVAGTLGSAAVPLRRTHPTTAVSVAAAAYALSGNPLPLAVGLWAAAASTSARRLVASVAVAWAGLVGWWWIDEGRLDVDDALTALLVTAAVAGVGAAVATRRDLRAARDAESAREARQRAVEQELRTEQARADERARIAREMHDVLAHKVSLIALHAGALEVGPGAEADQVRDGAVLIRVTAREALDDLRAVLGVLRGADDEPPGDLAAVVAEAVRAGQLVTLHDDAGTLPAPTARVVHRVAREALTNARKHAPGGRATVSVRRDDGQVTVTVDDSGPQRPALDLPGSGSGLAGLAERVRLVGGTLDAGPDPGGGWRVRAVVPWLDERTGEPSR